MKKIAVYLLVLLIIVSLVHATDHIVISEIAVNPSYGQDTTNDGKEFIELYNPTNATIALGGWYINFPDQLDVVIPQGKVIRANSFFLIGDTGGNGWPTTWSRPDVLANFVLKQTNVVYGLRLVNNFGNTTDAVGWNNIITQQNYYEGISLGFPDNGRSFERKPGSNSSTCGNWQDTQDNHADFIERIGHEPQNSTSNMEVPCNVPAGCTQNSDCNDGQFCNGVETCNTGTGQCVAGTSVQCGDNVSCTADSCNEQTDSCSHTPSDAICSDGAFCNGIERCNIASGCQPGTAVNCADNSSCTEDICNENMDRCDNIPNNNLCDDGIACTENKCGATGCTYAANNSRCTNSFYCDGQETCNPVSGCQNGAVVDCNSFNIAGVATCTNNPDNKAFTWDFRAAFASSCNEANDECTQDSSTLTHTCEKDCGAGCELDSDCQLGFYCNVVSCSCVATGQIFCGDGIKNGNEECDNSDLGGLTCTSFGFDSGSLSCLQNCSISKSNCFKYDTDNDSIPDVTDNCPTIANANQADSDQDGKGNVCDSCPNDAQNDIDQDTVCGNLDNCPTVANTNQADADSDGEGDACDLDADNDGINDATDTCQLDPQNDVDLDTICGNVDNCPAIANTDQLNFDNDSLGDACDADNDNDGVSNIQDFCQFDNNNDADNDEYCANVDNCPTVYNENQADADNDGIGNVCDVCVNDAMNDADQDTICGDTDHLTGGSDTLESNLACTEFTINNQTGLTNYNRVGHVEIKDCNGSLIVEFDFDFANDTLDLMDANITSAEGSIKVAGIAVPDTKTVYVDASINSNTLCIFDTEQFVASVDNDCSNGVKITCEGINGQYNCSKINNTYKVSGLSHSTVIEYSYTASQNNGGGSGGGGGGGGGSHTTSSCTESWKCTYWTACSAKGTQVRRCTDEKNCGTTITMPITEQKCTYTKPQEETTDASTESMITPIEAVNQTEEPQETKQTGFVITGAVVAAFISQNQNILLGLGILVIIIVAIILVAKGSQKKPKKRKRR